MKHSDYIESALSRLHKMSAHPDPYYIMISGEAKNGNLNSHYYDFRNDLYQLFLIQFMDTYRHIIDVIRELNIGSITNVNDRE